MKNSPSAHTRRSAARRGLRVYFSQAYCAATEPFDTMQKAGWIVESLRKRPIPGVELVEPEPLTADQMAKVHDPAYLDALRTGEPRTLAESSGLTWDAGIWTSLTASNGGVVAAALHAMTTRQNAGSLSSGIHHARASTGVALCAINGLALAARVVLDAGAKRVLIIDTDAHCGGGTYSIVRDWPEVTHLDVAVSPFDRYEPEPRGDSTLDIVKSTSDYLPTLRKRLADLDPAVFDVVLYGAGVDCHEGNGGPLGLNYAVLAEREVTVFEWAVGRVPVAFAMLGGYLSKTLQQEDVARLHRLGIAAAALANTGEELSAHAAMEMASTQEGTEGFAFDSTGRKTDAGFHADLLGDEAEDPFAFDLDDLLDLSPNEQEAFLKNRPGGSGGK